MPIHDFFGKTTSSTSTILDTLDYKPDVVYKEVHKYNSGLRMWRELVAAKLQDDDDVKQLKSKLLKDVDAIIKRDRKFVHAFKESKYRDTTEKQVKELVELASERVEREDIRAQNKITPKADASACGCSMSDYQK